MAFLSGLAKRAKTSRSRVIEEMLLERREKELASKD